MNEVTTVGLNRDEIIEAGKTDLNFFAALCLGDVYEFPFPPLYIAVWQMLTTAALQGVGQERLALGLPRGFAKTTLLKLFNAWLVLYSTRRFILVVCNTATLAENFVSDVDDMLSSENVRAVYGDWRLAMEKDTQELKKTVFRGRPVILAALGSGSSLRGLNLKNERPDTMILDDMQSKEEAESPVESAKQLSWMLGTLLKANNKKRCVFVFIGNMYPYTGSILKKLKHNPAWVSFITGAILEDGQSIWPALRSVEDILTELENDMSMGHPEIFFSEVMNDEEAGNKAGIDITKIQIFPFEDVEAEAGYVIIDPATGKKGKDKIAIGAVLIHDGKPTLWELSVGSFNPMEQITEAFRLAMKYGLMAIVVESVAYQSTLCFWMDRAKLQYGLHGLRILEIYPGGSAKNARIMDSLKQLTADKATMYLHKRVRMQVVAQVVQWNPLKTNNVDDILDLVAYMWPVINTYGMLLLRPFAMPASTPASHTDTLQLAF